MNPIIFNPKIDTFLDFWECIKCVILLTTTVSKKLHKTDSSGTYSSVVLWHECAKRAKYAENDVNEHAHHAFTPTIPEPEFTYSTYWYFTDSGFMTWFGFVTVKLTRCII